MSPMHGPKREGYYQGRILDCRDDLSERVQVHFDNCRYGIIDQTSVLHDIMPPAKQAGWGEQEVLASLMLLTGMRFLEQRRQLDGSFFKAHHATSRVR